MTRARLAPLARPAIVNGAAGAVVGQPGRPFAVIGFTIADRRITAIDLVLDHKKLAHVRAAEGRSRR